MSSDPAAVPFRLSASQMSEIWPGLDLIVKGYSAFCEKKDYPYSYPFRLVSPRPGFNRGTYSGDLMNQIIGLWKLLRGKTRTGGRVHMNPIEIRSAILAIRVNLDRWRRQRYDMRKCDEKTKQRFEIDRNSLIKLKKKAQRTIRSLERHLKRANSRLHSEVGKDCCDVLFSAWRAHVRWVRLHLVYFKQRQIGPPRSKTLYQAILNELENIAKVAIAEEGYEQASATELHRVMRLFTFSSRRGRQGKVDILYMLNHEHSILTKMNMAKFVLDRLDLKPLPEI